MKLWAKLMEWMGFDEDEDEGEELDETTENNDELAQVTRFRPNVVELQTSKNVKLVVLGPKSYDDVQQIADHLRAKRPVVVNLESADPRVRVRILDFLSGAVYALGGRSQRVSELIFLLAPTNIDISNLLDEDQVVIAADKNRRTGGV